MASCWDPEMDLLTVLLIEPLHGSYSGVVLGEGYSEFDGLKL